MVGHRVRLVIAIGLQATSQAAGFGLPDQGLVLAVRSLVAALVVGLGVTLVAPIAPPAEPRRSPPVEGMREGFAPTSASRLRRAVLGRPSPARSRPRRRRPVRRRRHHDSVSLLGLGALAVFIGVAQLSPVVAVPLAGTLGRPIAPLFRMTGKLAHANAVRTRTAPRRPASALMIGLALVTTVFIVGNSMKRTFAASIEDSVSADYVLSTEGSSGSAP